MATTQAEREASSFGDVPPKDVDRIFDAFFNIAGAMFRNMTPQEIADQVEMIDPDDVYDTFNAITNLPLFVEWAKTAKGRNALFDAIDKNVRR